jgi:DNA-binding NtrC family response regulator
MIDHAAARILLVDDEPQLLKMMTKYLMRLGYGVVSTSSTEEAWATIEAAPSGYALALVDMTMPGMSSEELLSKIAQAHPSVRLIACSGYPVDLSRLEGAGVVFLQKPFTPDMLAETVRGLLE